MNESERLTFISNWVRWACVNPADRLMLVFPLRCSESQRLLEVIHKLKMCHSPLLLIVIEPALASFRGLPTGLPLVPALGLFFEPLGLPTGRFPGGFSM
jgi:hypothetical protein